MRTAESQPMPLWALFVALAWLVLDWVRIMPLSGVVQPGHFLVWSLIHARYSDIISLYIHRHLAAHAIPYLQQPFEYPPVLAALVWLTSWAPGGVRGYLAANAVLLSVAFIGSVAVAAKIGGGYWHGGGG